MNKFMKKMKFFWSFYKERDWLEEMARQGWLLNNITLGMIYHFEKCEPCEKVYEIERFAITAHPTVAELTARTQALDITSQFGWKQITHDEDLNYYFVKDKAGDETDEFYDDPETRMERAERYRKHYAIDQVRSLLTGLLFVSVVYICLFFLMQDDPQVQHTFMVIYLFVASFEVLLIYKLITVGQQLYREFSMSRKEWNLHKKYDEKKSFNKVQQLRSYLQEKSEFGLALKGYEEGHFLFEEDDQRYNYFIDTKHCLKKRLKEDGITFTDEEKDWSVQSLKWYEMSIANAAKYDLKPVAVLDRSVLIYKRPYSDKPLPWENGNENLRFSSPAFAALVILLACFIVGFIAGFAGAMLG